MILYCAILPTMLHSIVLHKINKNADKDAVLLIGGTIYEKRGLSDCVEKIVENGFFTSFITAEKFVQKKNVSDEDYEADLIKYFDILFSENGYSIEDFEEIYTANDTWEAEINLYFNLKKIRYTWVQTAQNITMDQYVPDNLSKKYRHHSPLSLYASADILSNSDQSKKILEDNSRTYRTWDPKSAMSELSDECLNKLVHCFHIELNDDFGKSTLLILNSFGYSATLTGLNEEVKIHNREFLYSKADFYSVLSQFALDFYVNGDEKVYIKTHPNDPIDVGKVKTIFGDNSDLFTDAPFQIICEYFSRKNIKFDKIIGYVSSAIDALDEKLYNNFFNLGKDFFKTWIYYPSLYISLELLKTLEATRVYTHLHIKSQMEQLSRIYDLGAEIFDLDKNNQRMSFTDSSVIIDMSDNNYIRGIYPMLEKISHTNTIIFINSDIAPDFFEKKYMPYFSSVKISKICSEKTSVDIHRDETVWVYSTDPEIHRKLYTFSFSKELYRTGIILKVEKGSFNNSAELFKKRFIEKSLKRLSDYNLSLSRRLYSITEHALDSAIQQHDTENISKLMQNENNFEQYLDLLEVVKNRLVIIVAVKDTPGSCISERVIEKIKALGFTNFSKDIWKMYVGFIGKGNVICDITGSAPEEPVTFSHTDIGSGTHFELVSKAWRKGNQASIIINGNDYAVNARGINIVVYDIDKKEVVDSVRYDAHASADGVFSRK